MMNNGSSLSQSVQSVLDSKSTKAMKIKALKALNLTDYEAQLLVSGLPKQVREKAFKITFGVEIETFGFTRVTLLSRAQENGLNAEYQGYNHRDSNTIFKFVTDASVVDNEGRSSYAGSTAIECVSPVLSGDSKGYKSLENCCKTLNECDAKVNKSCGLHVHIGAGELTDEQYINIFVNYQHMQDVIDSFMAKSRRGDNARWCQGIKRFHFDRCQTKADVAHMMGDRYFRVNPESYSRHKTVEFRQHQGTTDYAKISAWVRFCAALVIWSRENRLTSDINSIDEIPFITKKDKEFFKARKETLA